MTVKIAADKSFDLSPAKLRFAVQENLWFSRAPCSRAVTIFDCDVPNTLCLSTPKNLSKIANF
ncbi:MAG: hypothetical protein ABFC34_06775 [Methanobacterium sp.]